MIAFLAVVVIIPAGPLTTAINRWSDHAGVQVMFPYEPLRDRTVPRIVCTENMVACLGRILEGSGLNWVDVPRVNNSSSVVIKSLYCEPAMGVMAPLPPCKQRPMQIRARVSPKTPAV